MRKKRPPMASVEEDMPPSRAGACGGPPPRTAVPQEGRPAGPPGGWRPHGIGHAGRPRPWWEDLEAQASTPVPRGPVVENPPPPTGEADDDYIEEDEPPQGETMDDNLAEDDTGGAEGEAAGAEAGDGAGEPAVAQSCAA